MAVKPIIAVWFSCGAASAVAAKKTIEKYGETHTIRIINNPIKEEDEDNRRFLKDVQNWLGVEIEIAKNPKWPDFSCETVWESRQYMAGVNGAPCTDELKKKARQYWEEFNLFNFNPENWLVLGFTADKREVLRYNNFKLNERENILPILIEYGITKADCYKIIKDAGIELPDTYKLGYPNANCIGCVKAASPTYWNHVRKVHPSVFAKRAEISRRIGARLVKVKGERIFLDELDEKARGQPMKSMDIECGIFCDMK